MPCDQKSKATPISAEEVAVVLGTLAHVLLGELGGGRDEYNKHEARVAAALSDMSKLQSTDAVQVALAATARWLGHS